MAAPSDEPARPQDAPILSAKDYEAPSAFKPEALLREARRQRGLPREPVPQMCVLDPDGDFVRRLKAEGAGHAYAGWACYHTEMLTVALEGVGDVGVIGCAVGASFAVLVAEQLFASGCRLLVSVTSAGQIASQGPTPYLVLIDRALRDEGTSYHYLPPSAFVSAPGLPLLSKVDDAVGAVVDVPVLRGATWTTDAPYRETDSAISWARSLDVLAVEMEAAALYAFARARRADVVCFAYVTNAMARSEGDFEKGHQDGTALFENVIAATGRAWLIAQG